MDLKGVKMGDTVKMRGRMSGMVQDGTVTGVVGAEIRVGSLTFLADGISNMGTWELISNQSVPASPDLAPLVALRDQIEQSTSRSIGVSDEAAKWRDAGYPPIGKPEPVDPWGEVITVDTGGRCPVPSDEELMFRTHARDGTWLDWVGPRAAGGLSWHGKRQFRRLKADQPGDAYWIGVEERVPDAGPAGLDIMDRIVERASGCPISGSISNLAPGDTFRRWLKP